MIGGWLQVGFGWRSVFAFFSAVHRSTLITCWKHLPETLPVENAVRLNHYLGRTYWKVLSSKVSPCLCRLIIKFCGVLYLHSVGAGLPDAPPCISETGFLWLFGPAMCGLICGSWSAGRMAGKLTPERSIIVGYLIMGSAGLINVGLNLSLPPCRAVERAPYSSTPLACQLRCRA